MLNNYPLRLGPCRHWTVLVNTLRKVSLQTNMKLLHTNTQVNNADFELNCDVTAPIGRPQCLGYLPIITSRPLSTGNVPATRSEPHRGQNSPNQRRGPAPAPHGVIRVRATCLTKILSRWLQLG